MRRLVIIVLTLIFSCSYAAAWGPVGHKAVAIIAESRLTTSALAETKSLLESEGTSSLEDIAMWADAVRFLKFPEQPLHGVYLPLDGSSYDPALDCRKTICAMEAIKSLTPVLSSRKQPVAARMMALKYIVHLVADLHQPLHATNAGAEMVTFDGKVQRLHKVWDVGITKEKKMTAASLAELAESEDQTFVPYRDPLAWAEEGFDISRNIILPEALAGSILPENYADQNFSIVEKRIHEAGWRLSELLNKALGDEDGVQAGVSTDD